MSDKVLTFTVTQTDEALSGSAKGDASVLGFVSMLLLWEGVALKRLGAEKTYRILRVAANRSLRDVVPGANEEHVE